MERLGGNLDEHFREMLNPAPSADIIVRLENVSMPFFENVSTVVDENEEPSVVLKSSGRLHNLELPETNMLACKVGNLEEPHLLLSPAASKAILAWVKALE